jgi:hypothetical protein
MIATSGSGHSTLANWSCAAFRTSLAYTSSTQGGRAPSSSSRSHGQGHIDYNAPRVRTSQIPGTSKTYASSTHKQAPGDIRIPGGLGRSLFLGTNWRPRATTFGLNTPPRARDGQCHVQTCVYINRLLVAHDAGATATVISLRLPFLTEPSVPANSSAYRVPPRPSMVARDSSRIFSNTADPFDWPTPSTLERLA